MQKLIELYKQWSGADPQNVQQLTAGGSNREYFRMTSSEGKSVIGCIGTSRDENHAFVYLAKHFSDCKLPVPTILAVSDDELLGKLKAYSENMKQTVMAKDAKLQETGYKNYTK